MTTRTGQTKPVCTNVAMTGMVNEFNGSSLIIPIKKIGEVLMRQALNNPVAMAIAYAFTHVALSKIQVF